jgi:propanol-preferring alcohol dehydrogenase
MGKKRMRAGVVRAFGKPLSIEEIPIPTPGPGEVLIKVAASGVCHTDLHAANGDWPVKPSLPFVPGHEGRVSLRLADRKTYTISLLQTNNARAWLHDACGRCEY